MRRLPTLVLEFPLRISAESALGVHLLQKQFGQMGILIMAANWQDNPEPGEEDWFVELTSDELDDEDFLEDFAEAPFELWPMMEEPFRRVVKIDG